MALQCRKELTLPEVFKVDIEKIDILWITAGLGCDGHPIAMTAATQPSIEDIVLGIIPGIPKVRFHNPVPCHRKRGRLRMKFFR